MKIAQIALSGVAVGVSIAMLTVSLIDFIGRNREE